MAEQDEAEWIRQTARGDRAAFEQIYRAYQRRVFGFIFRMVGSAETAEEVTSDVMLEVWKSARTFRGDSRVSTWILGIARFKALSARRRTRPDATALDEADALPDPHEGPDDTLVRSSQASHIRKALAMLSPDHREVMELTFFQGLSYPEIAQMLAVPVNTVKTRMFHARQYLRESLRAGELS